jgi:hypothetical protein
VPSMFTDLKVQNWGMLNGRLVCHDYGLTCTSLPRSMRAAKWWDNGGTESC